ncbi:MAG: M28 family peptidase [Planctomycetota bacterium]
MSPRIARLRSSPLLVVLALAACRAAPAPEPAAVSSAASAHGAPDHVHAAAEHGGGAHEAALDPHLALDARLTATVAWLADDAREGRRAGTESARESAHWIARALADAGLEPAGEHGNWFQSFEVALDARDGGRSVLQWSEGGTFATLPAVPLYCAEGGSAAGPLVWCGFGIDDAERGWDDFAGKDLKAGTTGSIAVIVRGTPDAPPPKIPESAPSPHGGPPPEPWGNAGSVFTKVMNAKRHGASGVLLLPKSAGEGVLAFDVGHGARAGLPCVTIDAEKAAVVKQRFFAGAELDLTRPAAALAPSKLAAEIRADVVREKGEALNVLGRVRGADSARCVVIGAHYDHLGHGGTGSLAPDAVGAIHNGADDNASGTAAVIEIARALALRNRALPCDVLVALWSGEEEGLLGSEHWAQHPTVPLERVKANLNLDMVGRAGNGKLQVLGAGTSSVFASWMEDAGKHAGLELAVNLAGGALGGSSDHQSFLKRGIPALHLFSGLHADYHKPTDDADKFEAQGAAKVVALGLDFVTRMASASKLDYVESKAPMGERTTPTGGFRVRLGSIPNYAYEGKGVLIDGASQGTPAERAGLTKGDVLVKLGDVQLDSVHDLTYALSHFKPGDVVPLRFVRDGVEQETRVTLVAPAGDVK